MDRRGDGPAVCDQEPVGSVPSRALGACDPLEERDGSSDPPVRVGVGRFELLPGEELCQVGGSVVAAEGASSGQDAAGEVVPPSAVPLAAIMPRSSGIW